VQVVIAPDVTLEGAHASDETLGPGVTVTVVVVLPPSVAVTVTVWEVATEPAVAVNVVELVVAGTVTVAETGSAVVLLEASVTVAPPVGAGWLNATVHVVATPETTVAGVHASNDTAGLGATVTVAIVLVLLPSVAVTVTVWEVATEPAVAVNVAAVALAGTAMKAGTGSTAVLLDTSVTVLPPTGAA
jgi:hypothetical protein